MCTSGVNYFCLSVAAKYQLEPTASIFARVNNSDLIGVDCTQILKPGVKLTLVALVDWKSIHARGHKDRVSL